MCGFAESGGGELGRGYWSHVRFDACPVCGSERQAKHGSYHTGETWIAPFCPVCDEPDMENSETK